MTDLPIDHKPIRYKTTRPVIPLTPQRTTNQARINDELKIELRPVQQSDLPHAHKLRTQQAVMMNTSTGHIDADLSITQTWLNRFLPPNDSKSYNFMLWANAGSGWEHVGVLGAHYLEPVAHIGYMLRTEWWGKGVASKAVGLFLEMWWKLERKEVLLELKGDEHARHLMGLEFGQDEVGEDEDGLKIVPEIMLAEVEQSNVGSIRVVERNGFVCKGEESIVEDAGPFLLKDYVLTKRC